MSESEKDKKGRMLRSLLKYLKMSKKTKILKKKKKKKKRKPTYSFVPPVSTARSTFPSHNRKRILLTMIKANLGA